MYGSILSWVAAITVMAGFAANSWNYRKTSFILWIVGDVFWIWWDLSINNPAHAALSGFIIFINILGWYKYNKEKEKDGTSKRGSES